MDKINNKKIKPLISIVSPTFNEAENIEELYSRIKEVISKLEDYEFEIIIIDNDSKDGTQDILRSIASKDKNFKVILNNRNFGHIRSPYFGILQAKGLAAIYLASDLQNPPELIPDIISRWEKGFKLVMAVKPESEGSILFNFLIK